VIVLCCGMSYCFFIRYMEFRLLVNIYMVSVLWSVICSVSSIANSFALNP
jgi:hypothetical protein